MSGKFHIERPHIRRSLFKSHSKPLLKHKLICKQTYMERLADSTTMGLLFQLRRFYRIYKPRAMLLTEQVVQIAKDQPNGTVEYSYVSSQIDETWHQSLRKLYKNNMLMQFIETDIVSDLIVLF